MYYYINSLYFYSLLGFILESTVYKIRGSKKHSSIFYGPITMVYGFGILFLLLIKKYFIDKLRVRKVKKVIIVFLTCTVILSFVELLGGIVLNKLFDIDMWNYSNKSFHFGKYVCFELALVWGILGTIYVYFLKDFLDQFINLIPKKLTIIFIILNVIDTFFVFVNKFPYW